MSRLRRLLPLALALLAAGCLSTTNGPGGPPGALVPAPPFVPDCSISNWADPCTALASPNESPSKAEIDLAANPRDPLNAVVASKDLDRQASNCVWSVAQVTKDGGRTWQTRYVGGTRAERMADPAHPLFGWDCITDPILVFDGGGIAYYALQAYNVASGGPSCPTDGLPLPDPAVGLVGCGSSFFLATSTDGGASWPADRIIPMALADGGLVFHDYPRMVVSPATGTVSTVWNAVGSAGVNPYVVSTRDQGRSVTRPTVVAAADAPRGTSFASGFAAASDGTVYMTVYIEPATGGASGPTRPVYLAVSRDDASSFGGFSKMFDVTPVTCPLPHVEFRCGTSIELAADTGSGPHKGRLYSVWDDGRSGHADILVSWTDDAGKTWTSPVRVNQDTTRHAQWMPRVKVGDDGTVHVLFLDRQHDADDRLYDATHAWSADGGATWGNQRLTAASSDGDQGIHQDGFPFIGDYVGIDVAGSHVWLGFPSTATGRAEIAVAHLVKAPTAPEVR